MKLHRIGTEQELEQERLARLRAKLREMVVEVEGPLALPCWIWQGRLRDKGYGVMDWERETHRAHRLAYRAWCGPIPDYQIICHICNVPACIQPAHLYAGTDASNAEDRDRTGGLARGEEVPSSVLTEPNVFAIIALLDKGYTRTSIAEQFGVTRHTIARIASGATWTHLPRPEGFAPRNVKRKLTETQAQEIIHLLAEGHPRAALAAQFGVALNTIHGIASCHRWAHLPRK